MGIYYNAATVIGYRISSENCYGPQTYEAACDHNPPPNVSYCPACGKANVIYTSRYRKDEFVDDFLDKFVNQLPEGYVFEELYDGDGDQFWFGYGSQVYDDEIKRVHPKPYDEIKAEIIAMLEPFTSIGLFVLDDAEFGIWTLRTGH